jgi:hypothetical protein
MARVIVSFIVTGVIVIREPILHRTDPEYQLLSGRCDGLFDERAAVAELPDR